MKEVFWLSAFVVAYVYVGYPLLLALWARLRPATIDSRASGGAVRLPPVSVVLAVRNEGHQLAPRLENLLSQEYPADRLEVVVVSDGSTDDTEQVAARYAARVRYIALPASGKAAALNAGVREARHPILVFADARQRFAPDAVRMLVLPFRDPRVGGVSGELHFAPRQEGAEQGMAGGGVGEGVGLYWGYEKWIRRHESAVGSVVGATGAIYALRRTAWRDLPPETLLDDVLGPLRAVLMGYRVVFEPRAQAFDVAADDASVERRRKTRTLAGNYQLLRLEPRLLVPGFNPVWLQLVSHKLGRLVVPYALVALLISNVALASAGLVYSVALILQVVFYVLALHGAAIALTPAATGSRAPGGPVGVPARLDERASEAPKELLNASRD